MPTFGKDFQTELQVLREEDIFIATSKRNHKTFKFTIILLNQL